MKGLLGIAVLLTLVGRVGAQSVEPSDGAVALDSFTVVVLPIEILTNEPKAPELADQVYDELMIQLAAVEGLYVLGRESVAGFSDTGLSPVEIARQLGAATVVSGEISIENNMYYGHLQIRDARGGDGGGGTSAGLDFLNPEHTHVTITARDGTETKLWPDDIRALVVGNAVEQVRESVFPQPRVDREQQRAESRDAFLDAARPDRDRLDALAALHREATSLDRDVIIVAVHMAETSDNPAVRRNIWSHMGRVPDAYVVAPLLYALQNDSDEEVRQQAAESLSAFVAGNTPDVKHRQFDQYAVFVIQIAVSCLPG